MQDYSARPFTLASRYTLIKALVELSWLETVLSPWISGKIAFASCLPSSTPHWSKELIPR